MKMLGFILGCLLLFCEVLVAGLWILMEWCWESGYRVGRWACRKVASLWRKPEA